MLFNSYIFIFIFFPLCILGFYLLAQRGKALLAKTWLIGMSLWFYGYFNAYYLLIMVLSILLNYGLTMWIIHNDGKQKPSYPLIIGICGNLGVLFYFKYFDFFLINVNNIFGTGLPLKEILLPLGISFFTFQQIGFLVDVYRGDVNKITFVDYALFVSFFPQLIAGPIVSQDEMLKQFDSVSGRKIDTEAFARGLTLFVLGLFKKVMIADTLGQAVDVGFSSIISMGGLDSFLIMIWYTLQLYFDFSGYCDMAKGLAGMLGFELPTNFDSPYKSRNIVEFWKKWHMTLTRFFTRYVYIPLGGNRKGTNRMLLNILVVYFLSGLWHGAGYNFILWGMLHGVMYVLVRIILLKNKKQEIDASLTLQHKITNVILTIVNFLYISFAWVYFRASSIAEGTLLIKNIFTKQWSSVNRVLSEEFKLPEFWYAIKIFRIDRFPISQNLLMILITGGVLGITFFAPNAIEISNKIKPSRKVALAITVLGIWCVLSLSQVSTFLYFNF